MNFAGHTTYGQAAMTDMAAGIERARDLHHTLPTETDAVEFEVRFGARTDSKAFTAGIPRSAFARIETRLDTGRDWARVDDWHNTRSFFYKRLMDDARVRTEASVIDGNKHQVESLIKTKFARFDWQLQHGLTTTPLAIRLDVNGEHRLATPTDLSESVSPHAVHLKQRKSYYYTPTGQTTPVWCYSLTRRWIGVSLEQALSNKANKEPVYELEIECIAPGYLVATDTTATAYKTLSKIADLIGLIEPALAKTPYTLLAISTGGSHHNPA